MLAASYQERLLESRRRLFPHLTGDQDPDLDLNNFGDLDHQDREIMITSLNSRDLDPDGLNSKIRGEFAELLKCDPAYLQARRWKVHPATLTNATKRMGADWVRKQVAFVEAKKGLNYPGRYLAKILSKNPF